MFDTHMHTFPFSSDSTMRLNEVLQKQKELSIGVVLTEHMDFNFPKPEEYSFIPSEYFEQYLPYRNNNLLLGAEIGMQSEITERNSKFINSAPFDMVIASVHAVSGYDLYYSDYYKDMLDKTNAYSICFPPFPSHIS